MKKKVKAISIIIMILFALTTIGSIACLATVTPDSIVPNDSVSTGSMITIGQNIIGFIKVFGIILSVGILVVLGIKYMLASPEGKADYKSSMIPYIIGAVLVFAATQIAGIVYQVMTK